MPAGATGLFRPLRHHLDPDARRLRLDGPWAQVLGLAGVWVSFALCGSPCLPPTESAVELPWCATCWTRRRLTFAGITQRPPVERGVR